MIARRVREAKVFCEIHLRRLNSDDFIPQLWRQGIILSGGQAPVTEGDTPRAPSVVFELGFRVGHFAWDTNHGPAIEVARMMTPKRLAKAREFGYSEVRATAIPRCSTTSPTSTVGRPRHAEGLDEPW